MSKFVKYLGKAHINSINIALYESGAVRAENVVNGKSIGAMTFASVEEAQAWFDSFDGDNTSRTVSAIDALSVSK